MAPKRSRRTINISNKPRPKRRTFGHQPQREDPEQTDANIPDAENESGDEDEDILSDSCEYSADNDADEEEVVDRMEDDGEEVKIVEFKGDVADEDPEDAIREEIEVFVPRHDAGAMDEENVELEPTEGAYKMLHHLTLECSALSFDIVPDALGVLRETPPHTLYFATGSSKAGKKNSVSVIKASNLRVTYQEPEDAASDEGLEEDEEYSEPQLCSVDNKIPTGVNRVRAMKQRPGIFACWGMDGMVYVYSMGDRMVGLEGGVVVENDSLVMTLNHRCEGVALDWSPVVPGRLVSGCLNGRIMLWEENQGKWIGSPQFYSGHKKSVEDLQFSPTEANVFVSASVDKTLKVWDVREKKSCVRSVKAHQTDVNVCHWNRLDPLRIISGDDAGVIKVWDFRMFQEPLAMFDWHQRAITSIEWSPHDPTVFAASSEDDTVTLWDISLEQDAEAAQQMQVEEVEGVPTNLLFIHQGQTQIKEVHWHEQIKGVLMSTALDGLDIFQPCNF